MMVTVHREFPIVVAVDGSPGSDRALDWAVDEAVAQGCGLTLAQVVGTHDSVEDLLTRAVRAVVTRAPALSVHQARQVGDPRTTLVNLSGEARLLVMGSRGRGVVRGRVQGSTSVAVSRRALPCGGRAPRQTACGVATRGAGRRRCHCGLACGPGLRLHVCRSARSASHGAALAGLRRPSRRRSGPCRPGSHDARVALGESLLGLTEAHPDVTVESAIVSDMPVIPLVHRSEHMDLVVVGRHQRTAGQQLMFAPLSAWLVEHARCSIAVVPVGPLRRGRE